MITTFPPHLLRLYLFQSSSRKTLKLSLPLSGYRGPPRPCTVHVNTFEEQDMKMDIQVQRAPEALNQGEAPVWDSKTDVDQ